MNTVWRWTSRCARTQLGSALLVILSSLAGTGDAARLVPATSAKAECARPNDPAGWFALDAAGPPNLSSVYGGSLGLALDATGEPWVADVTHPDRNIRVGHVVAGTLQLVPVPGALAGEDLALGLRGKKPILAVAIADKSLRIFEQDESWKNRDAPWLCKRILHSQGGSSGPTMVIDHQGEVWQACVDATYGPMRKTREPQITLEMIQVPPVVAARLRVGRLVGQRWVELPARAIPTTSRVVELIVEAAGTIGVRFDFQPQLAFRIDPVKRVLLPLAKVQTPATPVPVILPTRRGAQRGQRRFHVVGYGGCFGQRCATALGISDGDEPWRPLTGAWSFGVSGAGVMASRPAITLDRCGAPVVAWNDGAKNMVLQRWDGQTFRTVAKVPGDGPHGLAVDPQGDVVVGAWSQVNQHAAWQLTKVHDGAPQNLPLLTPAASEWISPVLERTRLVVSDGYRMSFPRSAGAPREGFVLTNGQWKPDPSAETILPTTSLPYPNKIIPPDFWTPSTVYATRSAAYSALAFDAHKRPLIVWAAEQRLHVSFWDGTQWLPIDDDSLPVTMVNDAPTITANQDRVCIAWSSVGATAAVFLRCHRLPPLTPANPGPSK